MYKNYIQQGFSVIPLVRGKKMGAVKWKEFQTRRATIEEADKWFTNTTHNVGIVTGAISGITVVDVDKKSGGLETLKTLNLPPTLTVKTGGGGWHYYYKYNPGARNNSAVLPGIDIRSEGGIVVAPPSVHKSGGIYECFTEFDRALIAEFPFHIFPKELLQKKKTDKDWADIVKNGVKQGNRNASLASLSGFLFSRIERRNWKVVKELLVMWATHKCKPSIPLAEIEKTILSIANLQIAKQEHKWYE